MHGSRIYSVSVFDQLVRPVPDFTTIGVKKEVSFLVAHDGMCGKPERYVEPRDFRWRLVEI